jgi:hypothetical protein
LIGERELYRLKIQDKNDCRRVDQLIDKREKSRAYMIQVIKEFYINDTAQEVHAKFESSDYIHRATVVG